MESGCVLLVRNRQNKSGFEVGGVNCDWNHNSPFRKSEQCIMRHDIKDSSSLLLEEECNLLMPRYLSHHIRSAAFFIVYMGIFGFLITLLNKILQGTFFVMMGYNFTGMAITSQSGDLFSTIPNNAPYWWYLMAFILPLLLVEGSILLLLFLTIRIEEKHPFLDGMRNTKLEINTIKKAVGWFCSVKIIVLVIFFPLTQMLYIFLLGINKESDLTIAWQSLSYINNPVEIIIMEFAIIFAYAYLLVISSLYLYTSSKSTIVT